MTNKKFKRGCLRKARHESKVHAEWEADAKMRAGSPPLRAYKCSFCKGWHLTSQVKEQA